MQNLVFKAVECIWPSPDPVKEPTLLVVAASNAQAKNISTAAVQARTLHNAGGMRVQRMVNSQMHPGDKMRKALERLWGRGKVLVMEEISMTGAALYNMLDFRAMHGRQKTHQVCERTYKLPHHAFGRFPIVIKLGDFLQLSPTNQIGLAADTNEKGEDGKYKISAEALTPEIDHAIKMFNDVEHDIGLGSPAGVRLNRF